jgi:dipeptidyl aminopeptidase/acylaminoacyl peptidase
MPDTVNPYIPGQPVSDPDLFFGRREVLTSIGENLVKGRRVFVVSSPPRMGRSSLLRQVGHHLPEDLVAVRLDLLEEEVTKLDWLLWRLADAVSEGVRRQLDVRVTAPAWEAFEGQTGLLVERFWPEVRAALGDGGLALLLDDLDALAQGDGQLLKNFLAVLGAWRDQAPNLALVVTASPAWQAALLRDHPRLFAGALTYTLGPLASEEASRLITWPVDGVLTYDYGVARRVIEVTSGHPYYLQLLCFEIVNRCAAAGWVNQRDLDIVVEDLVSREISDFRLVWEQSSPPEQAALAALVSLRGARGVATVQEVRTSLAKAGARTERGQVAVALEHLAERGILERLGALSYRFRVALLRDWLGQRLDLREVARNTRWDSSAAPRALSEPGVMRLKPGQRARSGPVVPASEGTDGMAPGTEKPAGVRRRPWLWVGGAALVLVALLVLLGPPLFGALSPDPTPTLTPTLPLAATVRLATATHTRAPSAAVQDTATLALPSPTPRPQATLTPSPTPPLIVSRPVPAIAYQSRGSGDDFWSIYVMSSDGSNRTTLTQGQSGFLSPPSWSSDGSRLAFVSDRSGSTDVWVMDIDGSNLVNLTDEEAKDHSPAWSPDGQWIAFASLRDALYWELYVMRPDGSDVQRLTWWEDASDLYPSWSPDGTRLAFASKRDGNWEIYTMDRDGSNLVRLTDHPADDTNPAWSPDGSRIAFESQREGYAEIFVMAVIGGEPTNISNAPFSSEHGPTWSPDGGRIAFYSDRDGEWDIYVMGSDGSDVVKLTGDNTNDQVPAWRP